MKRLLSLLLGCCVCLSMFTFPIVANATTTSHIIDMLDATFNMESAFGTWKETDDGNYMMLDKSEATDENVYFNIDSAKLDSIQVASYPYIAIRYKTNIVDSVAGNPLGIQLRAYNEGWTTGPHGGAATPGVDTLNANGEWNTFVFAWTADGIFADWETAGNFEGTYSSLRLDIYDGLPIATETHVFGYGDKPLTIDDGEYLYLDSIAFFSNPTDAAAYSGIDRTPKSHTIDVADSAQTTISGEKLWEVADDGNIILDHDSQNEVWTNFTFTGLQDKDVSVYKYIAIRYKTNIVNTKEGEGYPLGIQLRVTTTGQVLNPGEFDPASAGWIGLTADGEWNTVVVPYDNTGFFFGNVTSYTGGYANIRLDVFDGVNFSGTHMFEATGADTLTLDDGEYIYINSIGIFNNATAAAAFTGIDRTPTTTEAPDTTEAPTTTPSPTPVLGNPVNLVDKDEAIFVDREGTSVDPIDGVWTLSEDGEYWTLNAADGRPYNGLFTEIVLTGFEDIDVSTYKYIAIRYKTNINNDVDGYPLNMQLRVTSTGQVLGAGEFDPASKGLDALNANGEWNTIVFVFDSNNFFFGNESSYTGGYDRLRIDMYDGVNVAGLEHIFGSADQKTLTIDDDEYFYIDSISFFDNAEDAAAYAGLTNTTSGTNPVTGDAEVSYVAMAAVVLVAAVLVVMKKRAYEA